MCKELVASSTHIRADVSYMCLYNLLVFGHMVVNDMVESWSCHALTRTLNINGVDMYTCNMYTHLHVLHGARSVYTYLSMRVSPTNQGCVVDLAFCITSTTLSLMTFL